MYKVDVSDRAEEDLDRVIKNYIMIYKVYEDKKTVIAYGFFYGGRDYVTLM